MDGGSVIVLVIIGLIFLAIVIGSAVAISCTILYGDRLRPRRTTGQYWINQTGNEIVLPPQPIFTTPEALSCEKILTHCNNILTHSHYEPVEICYPPSHTSIDTHNTNQSNASFSTHLTNQHAISSIFYPNKNEAQKSAPLPDSNMQPIRPRSQSLGGAPIILTPPGGWTSLSKKMPHTAHYKLTYFNIYGLAEPIRLIFAQAGVKYEDERLDDAAWAKKKPTTPNGQLPLLEVDGKLLPQSKAIATYLAKQFDLNGQSDWEAAQVQALIAGLDDVRAQARPWYMEKDVTKKAELFQKLEHDTILPYLDRMEKTLKENGTGYFVGSHLTQADLHLFNSLQRWDDAGLISAALKKHPELVKFEEKIGHLPKIKEWIDHRPKTDM